MGVLIIGDVGIDRNYHGQATELSPEGPYPVIKVQTTNENLSCAGNIVNSVTEFFDKIFFITCLKTSEAERIKERLDQNVIHINISQDDRTLQVINRVHVGNYVVSRFDEQNIVPINDNSVTKFISTVEQIMKDVEVLILSDYGLGLLTPSLCEQIIRLSNVKDIPVFVDPFLDGWEKFKNVTLIKPNRVEASSFLGKSITTDLFIGFTKSLLKMFGITYVLCTMDEDGMMLGFDDKAENGQHRREEEKKKEEEEEKGQELLNEEEKRSQEKPVNGNSQKEDELNCSTSGEKDDAEEEKIKIIEKPIIPSVLCDVIGCGDALIAAIAVFYSKNKYRFFESQLEMVDLLTRIGSIAVSTLGCYHLNLMDWNKVYVEQKALLPYMHNQVAHTLLKQHKKVVFTNGCFDVLHAGHIRLLKECKKLGDYLIVAINSDDSVSRLKGPTRPINTLNDRMAMLNEIGVIDELIPFDEDTPTNLIQRIRPDLLVKGGDYKLEDIIGREYAKETITLDFPHLMKFSSTNIISRCVDKHIHRIKL